MLRKVNRKNKWKRLGHDYSSFIPLSSMVTLLALLTILTNPNPINNNVNEVYAADTTSTTPSASLSIANPTLSATGKAGEVVTMSNNVSVEGILINSYNLQISSGNTNGSTTLEGPTTINPIDNTTNPNGIDISSMGDNTWGYKWGDSSTGNNTNNYKGITTTPVAIANDSIDSNGTVSYTKPLTFAAKFSKEALAGHYTTTINLSLTATPKELTTYTLTYNLNGGNISGNTTNPTQECKTYDTSCSITMAYTNPTRSGYDFLGWADSSSATSANTNSYGNGKVVTVSGNKIIYAVWKTNGAQWLWSTDGSGTGIYSGINTMQEMTSSICGQVSTPTASTTAGATKVPTLKLTDARDNKIYTIAKFPDGKCWMTQNLNLRLSTGTSLTSTTSDVSNWWPTQNTIVGLSSVTSSDFYTTDDSYRAQSYASSSSASTTHYSWLAATAGSGSTSIADGGNASYSICPKGWRLPTGGSSGEFQALVTAAKFSSGVTISEGAPYNFGYNTSSVNNNGANITTNVTTTSWWSSTSKGLYMYRYYAYALFATSSSIAASTAVFHSAAAIRCVAR